MIIIKNLFIKYFFRYKSIILYIFFGGLTTLINIVSYYIFKNYVFSDLPFLANTLGNAIAWLFSVLFAFVTNKIWVFESKSWNRNIIIKEIISFFSFRFATGLVDMGIMIIGVDFLKFNDLITKILSNIFVLISNYIGSKFFIFKKNK